MGRSSVLILSYIILFTNSCCIPIIQKGYYNTNEGFERPNKSRFKFSKNPYMLKNSDFIKTTCIYQATFSLEYKKPENNETITTEVTRFFRFFENGKYFSSAVLKDNDPIYYYNNLKRGHVGYYKIVNNKIILEHFNVGANDCGKYHITELEIIGDNISSFKKIEIEGLTGTPDW